MPAPLGGIGQQVADNLFELGKSTVKAAADAGKKIAEGTYEQIAGAPGGTGLKQPDAGRSPEDAQKEQKRAIKKQEDNRRYEQVKSELEQYRQRRAQLDQQIAQEKAQEQQQKEQKDAQVRQERESFVQKLLHRTAGAAHGETAKMKE